MEKFEDVYQNVVNDKKKEKELDMTMYREKQSHMGTEFLPQNYMLIQGVTLNDLENMISRLLDEKLANIFESIPKQAEVPENGLYKRKEAAEKLLVSLVTLDTWTKAGIITARRIGGRVYYTDKDINDALKKVAK